MSLSPPNRRRLHAALLALSLPVSGSALAQDAEPTPEMKRTVEALAGKWKLETTLMPRGGKPSKFPGTLECTRVALGRALTCVDRPGTSDRAEYAWLVGYDGEGKNVRIFVIGSTGEVRDYKCGWSNDKLGCRPSRGTFKGKLVTHEMSFTFAGDALSIDGLITEDDTETSFTSAGKRVAK
jgi:hypothetical protein